MATGLNKSFLVKEIKMAERAVKLDRKEGGDQSHNDYAENREELAYLKKELRKLNLRTPRRKR